MLLHFTFTRCLGKLICLVVIAVAMSCEVQGQSQSVLSDWTFRAGTLILDAGGSLPDRDLLTRGNLSPVLRSGSIDAGVSAGWEMELSKQLSRDWSIGARYSRIDSFGDELFAASVVNGSGVRFSNTVVGVLGAVTGTYRLSYGADLSSLDFMAKRRLTDWWKVSAGVRYLQFNDQLAATLTGGGFTTRIGLDASNDLIGGQLGSELLLLEVSRFSILANGLAGVYYNDVDTRITTRTNVTRTTQFSTDCTSFIGELELKGRYQLCRKIYMEGGYRLLFLENIALATEQASINRAPPSAMSAADTGDSRMLQGATANLVFEF